jgi:hypothetical protein
MDKNILNQKQKNLLNIVEYFSKKNFYLAGGTALALQMGHRESIDFDMFSYREFNNQDIYKDLIVLGVKKNNLEVLIDKLDEYTLFINDVKFTFLRYPFVIEDVLKKDKISLASPLTIGAMKAYALGRRGKWKDYVDLYILLQKYPLKKIISKAKKLFKNSFSEKMFLQQICYFEDLDYTESVIWLIEDIPQDDEIRNFLREVSVKNS